MAGSCLRGRRESWAGTPRCGGSTWAKSSPWVRGWFRKCGQAATKFPQGLKPLILLAVFGTTEVVPFQDPIYVTSQSRRLTAPCSRDFRGWDGFDPAGSGRGCAPFQGSSADGFRRVPEGAGRCIGTHRRIASKVVLL